MKNHSLAQCHVNWPHLEPPHGHIIIPVAPTPNQSLTFSRGDKFTKFTTIEHTTPVAAPFAQILFTVVALEFINYA